MHTKSENSENKLVGTEWLIDAELCDPETLRDEDTIRGIFENIIEDLGLRTIGVGNWHKFEGEGGITGLVMLTESHLACHTYPEYGVATFNLYCCRTRPEWDWETNLKESLGAENVNIQKIVRGDLGFKIRNPKLNIQNSKFKNVGGKI